MPKTLEIELTHLPIGALKASATNPRKFFDEKELADLASSIAEKGVLEPILVRKMDGAGDIKAIAYEIVAGERRYRASKKAGLEKVPCIIRELTDQQVVEIQVVENMQRQDLTPIEEATGYKALVDDFKYTLEDLAVKIGKSKSYINMRFRLLTLSPAVRKALADQKLSLVMAMELLRVPSHEGQDDLLKDCAGVSKWPDISDAKNLRETIDSEYLLDLSKAPFNTKDAELCPKAGACLACPKRTGAQDGLFGDMGKKDTCLDKSCWQLKIDTQGKNLVAKYKAEGKEVLKGDAAEKVLENPHARGFVKLDEKVTDLVGATTTRQALRKNGAEDKIPVTAAIDGRGVIQQFVRINDVQRVLPKKAFKASHDASDGRAVRAGKMSEKDRKARAQRLAELTAGRTLWPLLWPKAIEKVIAKPLTGPGLKIFMEVLIEYHASSDMRGPAEDRINDGKHDIEEELLVAKSDKALLTLLWQMMLGTGQLNFDNARISQSADGVLKLAGIDWKKELAAEAKKVLEAKKAAKK